MIEAIIHHYRRLADHTARFIAAVNHTSDRKLLCLLFLCFAVWRFLTLDLIEASGDAIWKWRFLRYFTELGEWFPTGVEHHQGRWGLNIPVLGIMKLFGTDPWAACIYPLVIAFLCGLLIYLITRRIASRFAACSAYLIFLLLPQTARESSQFLPMLPATCFILLAIWLILRYLEQPEKTFLLFLSGLAVGVSYGCKFTSLYWALAFALFLSLYTDQNSRRHLWKFRLNRPFLLFSCGVFLVLILETLCLNLWFGISFGRVQMIMSGHLHNRPSPQYMGLAEYLFSFLRPLDLKGKFVETFPYACILLGGIFVVLLWLKKQKPAVRLLTFSFITVYLLHSYMVYKVFPFLHPERPHGRYFLVLLTLLRRSRSLRRFPHTLDLSHTLPPLLLLPRSRQCRSQCLHRLLPRLLLPADPLSADPLHSPLQLLPQQSARLRGESGSHGRHHGGELQHLLPLQVCEGRLEWRERQVATRSRSKTATSTG